MILSPCYYKSSKILGLCGWGGGGSHLMSKGETPDQVYREKSKVSALGPRPFLSAESEFIWYANHSPEKVL